MYKNMNVKYERGVYHNMKKIMLLAALSVVCALAPGIRAEAEELTPVTQVSRQERTITVTAEEAEEIGALYIQWDNPVEPYQIVTEAGTLSCGENGFLHEFIPLPEKSSSVTIVFPEENMEIYQLRLFTDEAVPADVQIWQPPCERADIMIVSAHSDDEILFMGGVIPTYGAEGGARVQVVYMSEFWSTTPVREHEKLDGLWEDGLTTYPVCGGFRDLYAKDLKQAEKLYDLQAMTDYLTDTIRRFQPQVVVTHDFKGEYGHGFHQLTAKAVSQALEAAADDACRTDTESFLACGSWDVPKAYFHLYPENQIRMDLNVPLASMGGRTALETAKAAYQKHVSQQWCWFYVSDTYEYSCADFGLYRTSVGYDTADDMLENIVLYSEQEELARIAEEERERLRQEELELERQRQEQMKQEALEQERQRQEQLQEALEQERQRQEQDALARKADERRTAIILVSIGILLPVWILRLALRRRKRK